MRIPVEVAVLSVEQQAYLRQYRRLWLTDIDLEESRASITEIFRRDLRRGSTHRPTPLLQSLTTALIVSYSRPFVMSRGDTSFADRTVPGSLLRVFTSGERALHDILIEMRNREVAHTDAEVTQFSLELFPAGHGGICRVTRDPLPRPQLRQLLKMIGKLGDELNLRFEELRNRLPHNVWL